MYWSRFMDSCRRLGSPLSSNQLKNYRFDDETFEIILLGRLLSDLLPRQSIQMQFFIINNLQDRTKFTQSLSAAIGGGWNAFFHGQCVVCMQRRRHEQRDRSVHAVMD